VQRPPAEESSEVQFDRHETASPKQVHKRIKDGGFLQENGFALGAGIALLVVAIGMFLFCRRRVAAGGVLGGGGDKYSQIEMEPLESDHDAEAIFGDASPPVSAGPPKKKGMSLKAPAKDRRAAEKAAKQSKVPDPFDDGDGEVSGLLAAPVLEPTTSDGPAGSGWGDSDWADFDASDSTSYPSLVALDREGLKIIFDFEKTSADSDTTTIMATIKSSLSEPLTNFVCKAAVPRYLKITMGPPSSNLLSPGGLGAITQTMVIKNLEQGKRTLRVRLRIEYLHKGVVKNDMEDVFNFPRGL